MRNRSLFTSCLVGALVALAACAGPSPLEPSSDVGGSPMLSQGKDGTSGMGVTLVYCKPFDEASKSATIGVLGGTIKIGPHSLWIPPGALLSPKTITARIVKNDYSNSVQFFPEGLRFLTPAVVTLSHANCDRQTLLKQLRVVYTSSDLRSILDLLPSVNNPVNRTTIGTIQHFSRYAIAY